MKKLIFVLLLMFILVGCTNTAELKDFAKSKFSEAVLYLEDIEHSATEINDVKWITMNMSDDDKNYKNVYYFISYKHIIEDEEKYITIIVYTGSENKIEVDDKYESHDLMMESYDNYLGNAKKFQSLTGVIGILTPDENIKFSYRAGTFSRKEILKLLVEN